MVQKFRHFKQIILTLAATHRRFKLEPMAVCTDTAPPDFFFFFFFAGRGKVKELKITIVADVFFIKHTEWKLEKGYLKLGNKLQSHQIYKKNSWMYGHWSYHNFSHDRNMFYVAQQSHTTKFLSMWMHLNRN